MEQNPENESADEKRERTMRILRKVWTGLILVFIVVIILNLYNWSQGKGDLRGILSPIGMIFVGLATIVSKRNSKLYYTLIALALIFVVSALVLLIIY